MFGTEVDLIETLKSVNSSRSISSTNSTAALTSASTGVVELERCRCLGSEPELTPMRIGVPAALAAAATSATLSGPPMLPGFRRMQCAPASIDFSASVWLKWMSAITGIGDSATIVLQRLDVLLARDGAAHDVGAGVGHAADLVHRRLQVGRLGLGHGLDHDGAPPPIWTPPTLTDRSEAIAPKSRSAEVLKSKSLMPKHL